MSERKTPILLTLGPLTHRIYAVTRYRDLGNGNIDAQTKHDVTDQFGAVLDELDRLGLELRPKPKVSVSDEGSGAS